jgi:hypothetical protein
MCAMFLSVLQHRHSNDNNSDDGDGDTTDNGEWIDGMDCGWRWIRETGTPAEKRVRLFLKVVPGANRASFSTLPPCKYLPSVGTGQEELAGAGTVTSTHSHSHPPPTPVASLDTSLLPPSYLRR